MYQMDMVLVNISCMHQIAYHTAHSFPWCPIYWLTHLHCDLFTGPPVSIAPYLLLAHLSSSHITIHNLIYIILLYYHLYYIPLAHLIASSTHYPSAHLSIMV
jgi:hypothetical protein